MAKPLPWFPCFVEDAEKLRTCSLAARGLYHDLMLQMHKGDRRGFLQRADGQPWTAEQIGHCAGCSPAEASGLLRELVDSGALSVDERCVVYSRNMVRDQHRRQLGRQNGRLGGNPALSGAKGTNGKMGPTQPDQSQIGLTGMPTQSQPPGQPPAQPPPCVCVIEKDLGSSQKKEIPKHPHQEGGAGGGGERNGLTQSRKGLTQSRGGAPAAEGFEAFWAAYPRKENKANAQKAFARLGPGPELLVVMLEALAKQGQTSQWLRGVIPHAATWINGRRWEDEVAAPPGLLFDFQET